LKKELKERAYFEPPGKLYAVTTFQHLSTTAFALILGNVNFIISFLHSS